jgi:hypothetical protein
MYKNPEVLLSEESLGGKFLFDFFHEFLFKKAHISF